MVAGVSFFLVISILKGKASLHVTTGGSGKRPSTLINGGENCGSVSVDALRKRPGFSGTSIFGLKWCDRLANDSRLFGGWRGGSMGKNMNGTVCF